MRRTVSNKALFIGITVILTLFVAVPIAMRAATHSQDTTAAVSDTTKRADHVKIRIDERGISVEAEDGKGGTVVHKPGGPTITIEGTKDIFKGSSSDIIRFGEDVHLRKDETARGNVVVFGGRVTVEGRVMGDIVVFGGRLILHSGAEVNGDAVVIGGTIEEDPDVNIQGEKVVMSGKIPFLGLGSHFSPKLRLISLMTMPVKYVVFLCIALLVLLAMGARTDRARSFLRTEYLKSFGWGLLVCFISVFVIPIAVVLLAITLIGIPLAILVLFSVIVFLFIALTLFAYDIGLRIKEWWNLGTTNKYALLLIGSVAVFLPGFIGNVLMVAPLIWGLGFAIKILANVIIFFGVACGTGALFTSRFGSREKFAGRTEPGAPPEMPYAPEIPRE
jgi:hypothetical protein